MSENQLVKQNEKTAVSEAVTVATTASSATAVAAQTYALMLREIRSWGFWLLGLGALNMLASGFLSAPYGILLLIVGIASFYFREAAMFVIYGVTLVWAAISNILGGDASWILFALVQLVMAFQVFRQFNRFRRSQADYGALSTIGASGTSLVPERAGRVFPWAGCLIVALSLGSLVAIFVVSIILIGFMEATVPSAFLGFMIALAVNLGVLGLAISLAAFLSGYRYKLLAALGIVGGILELLAWVALVLLG